MSEFVDYLHEVFEHFGPLHPRRMFGGYGIYHQGVMIAIVVDEVLYLKADRQSAPHFKALDLPRFEYLKQGKPVRMSFYAAPEEVFEDPDQAVLWGRRAYQAALRARRPGSTN